MKTESLEISGSLGDTLAKLGFVLEQATASTVAVRLNLLRAGPCFTYGATIYGFNLSAFVAELESMEANAKNVAVLSSFDGELDLKILRCREVLDEYWINGRFVEQFSNPDVRDNAVVSLELHHFRVVGAVVHELSRTIRLFLEQHQIDLRHPMMSQTSGLSPPSGEER